jgi:hypothetical protein
VPILHILKLGHQPQPDEKVQSKQEERNVHGSGGIEPLVKDAQLKTDRTGSVAQIEFATAQLLLMELKRVSAVMYRRDPNDEVGTMLQPKDNVAVLPLALKEICTA